jgi:hypothetical protein
MKNLKVNKISVTGKSYKLVAEPKGFLQLMRAECNDAEALSIIKKGSTPFYCPICGKAECIQQPGPADLRYVINLNVDIDRTFCREIRTCVNNENKIKNNENIHNVMLNPENIEEALKLLADQNEYFYIVENFSLVLVNPPSQKSIICPSCGSSKFQSQLPSRLESSPKIKMAKCPACSMQFMISCALSALPIIADQLYRKDLPEPLHLIPMGTEIKHILIFYDVLYLAKVSENNRLFYNYPTDYYKLDVSVKFEELLNLFRGFTETHEENVFQKPSDTKLEEHKGELTKYHAFLPFTAPKLLVDLLKKEGYNALMIFVYAWNFSEISYNEPEAHEVRTRIAKTNQPWLKFESTILIKYLQNKGAIKYTMPTSCFTFVSEKYPSQVDDPSDWVKTGKWTEILKKDVAITPSNP